MRVAKINLFFILLVLFFVASCKAIDVSSKNTFDEKDLAVMSSLYDCGDILIASKLRVNHELVFNGFDEFIAYLKKSLSKKEYSILMKAAQMTLSKLKNTSYGVEDLESKYIVNLEASLKEHVTSSGEFDCSSEIFSIANSVTDNKVYNFNSKGFQSLFEKQMVDTDFQKRKSKLWLLIFIY